MKHQEMPVPGYSLLIFFAKAVPSVSCIKSMETVQNRTQYIMLGVPGFRNKVVSELGCEDFLGKQCFGTACCSCSAGMKDAAASDSSCVISQSFTFLMLHTRWRASFVSCQALRWLLQCQAAGMSFGPAGHGLCGQPVPLREVLSSATHSERSGRARLSPMAGTAL